MKTFLLLTLLLTVGVARAEEDTMAMESNLSIGRISMTGEGVELKGLNVTVLESDGEGNEKRKRVKAYVEMASADEFAGYVALKAMNAKVSLVYDITDVSETETCPFRELMYSRMEDGEKFNFCYVVSVTDVIVQ